MSEVEYMYVKQLYDGGVCDVACFKAWHDHSFGGVYPESLWFDMVKHNPSLILSSELYSLKKFRRERREGCVVYDLVAGHQVEDRSVPTRMMRDTDAGGVVLMYSGGGKSHFVAAAGTSDIVDGDKLVSFPAGWSKDARLRKDVMSQYEQNVQQAVFNGKTVLVNMNDMKIVDKWLRSGIIVGFVRIHQAELRERARCNMLRSDQVGRIRNLSDSQMAWQKCGIVEYPSLDAAVQAARECIRCHGIPLLPQLLALIRRNQYSVDEHSWMARRVWPGTSKMLDEREQVSAPLALALAQQQIKDKVVGFAEVREVLQMCVGLGSQCVTNVVMWCVGLKGGWTEMLRIQELFGFFNGDLRSFMEVTKLFHNVVRNTDDVSWFSGCFTADHYLYFNLLPGRFFFSHLNFRSELQSRMEPIRPIDDGAYGQPEGTFEELVENVIDYLGHLFAEGSVARAQANLEDFCADFLTWSTSGSAPSAGLSIKMPDGSTMRTSGGNKSSQLNTMGCRGIMECLGMPPSCIGQPTYKFEAGKLRMLLPGPLKHWIVESIALWGGEGHVMRSIPEIAMEQSSYVEFTQLTNRLASTGSGMARACSDYADYNILHSFERMRKLWLAQAAALDARLALPADVVTSDSQSMLNFIRAACRWSAAALDNVQAKIGPGEYVRLVRGLWTGWRSTMYINVSFNFAYTTAQRLMFIKRYGIDPLSRYNVLGDDMEGDAPSLWTALRFVSTIDKLGLDAQASKQMVSIRRAEFLRLMYRDGRTISGSYCRGITGFTSGDTQTSPRYAGVKSAQNVCSGLNRLMRRGGNIALLERAKLLLVKHWSTIKMGGSSYRPDKSVLRAPTWLGGMGICRADGTDIVYEQVKRIRVRPMRFSQTNSELSKLMVTKGWNVISKWNNIIAPNHQDVDATILTSIMPANLRRKFAHMERADTCEYYKQRGFKISKALVPELHSLFAATAQVIEDPTQGPMHVTQRPNDWWDGLVRDALGPLASHPKVDRFLGKTGSEKLENVLSSVTTKVLTAQERFLGLDEQTRLNTATGNLAQPSPLAGLVSPISRHLVAVCHSHIVGWLCKQQCISSSAWNRCIANALYTFELFFLEHQHTLILKYRV
ncbi:putative RNA-dependent RNA polymerase [Freshwater macrophyte associated ghabri-like virus 1]|nr:putative RNA-dependent RNA polymerase [Freshwater macrophyte associated ghabri-like virus 1]